MPVPWRRDHGRAGSAGLGQEHHRPAPGRTAANPCRAGLGRLHEPATALAGRDIRQNPETWPAYRELVRTVTATVAHLPVVLLGVCTPAELHGWPINAWALLDCADHERRRRLARHVEPDRVQDAVRDGREYRSLGLPVIDTTSRPPAAVAAELAQFVHW